jgi:outer membrane protein
MKMTTFAVATACLVALTGPGRAAAETIRIATVDLNRIFEEYHKTPVARQKLDETKDSYQKELRDMDTELRRLQEELNQLRDDQDRPEYSDEVREQKRRALQEKLAEFQKQARHFQEHSRTYEKMLADRTQTMRTSLLREITETINAQARERGYSLVLDTSGNTFNAVPAVIYAQDHLDITEEILKILNRNKNRLAPATDAPAPAPNQPQ